MRFALSFSVAALALGCGSSVTPSSDATTTAAGAGAASVGSGNGAATGQGGASSASVTTTSGSGGAGGTSLCESGFIDIDGDGPTQHLVGSCPNTYGSFRSQRPVAYFILAATHFVAPLEIMGCAQPNAAAPSLTISALGVDSNDPGTVNGSLDYTDAAGTKWSPTEAAAAIVITKMTQVTGDSVEGTFKGDVASLSADPLALSGSFRACKIDDLNAP